jgi:adenylate cyclase
LACIREADVLYASPDWRGLPPLVTRFGIHVDTVSVGHFGAPSRLSYTALGDGVNLASRLEGLCKQYGIVTLASDAVEERARDEFAFRLVDRVVVKGKTTALTVYEILGAVDEPIANLALARAYERAFAAYTRGAFGEALSLLGPLENDGPSRVLAERCARYLAHPPPPEWDGTFHAEHK